LRIIDGVSRFHPVLNPSTVKAGASRNPGEHKKKKTEATHRNTGRQSFPSASLVCHSQQIVVAPSKFPIKETPGAPFEYQPP